MSKSIQALRERHNALARELNNLLEQNPGATWKAEHQTQYDEKMAEIETIRAEIRRLEAVASLDVEARAEEMGIQIHQNVTTTAVRNALYDRWLRGGDSALSAQEWQTVRNTMSTGVGSEGGFTVQQEVASELIKATKAFGGLFEVATSFNTSTGASMSWPSLDDTANEGEIVAENVSATDLDPAFGNVSMATYKFSSKTVAVPIELLQDSQVDIESVVTELLGERLARVRHRKYTVGTGTAEPRGIVVASGVGKVGATGTTTSVSYDDLVALEHSVDPSYRSGRGVGFMMHDDAIAMIRKIKDTQGRPIFVPGYEQGNPGGAPDRLLNRPITPNQHMAAPAANAKSILFGLLSNYRIRNVMAATMFRFTDSAYTKKGQVGFLAWQRAGGNLLDISGTTVRHYQHSAT
ncbi:MAG TPA: phage major capsid protein [Lysobacter sp.]